MKPEQTAGVGLVGGRWVPDPACRLERTADGTQSEAEMGPGRTIGGPCNRNEVRLVG
jgi:hypothetical protein